MASLKDLGPLTQIVNVRGVDYEVKGIGMSDVFDLLVAFPTLEKLMDGKVKDFNAVQIIREAPDAVGTIIITAIGKKGDKAELEQANKLGFHDQLKFMTPIFDLTFSEGIGPFAEELKALFQMIGPKTKGSDTASPALASAQLVMVGRSKKPGKQLLAALRRGMN